MTDKEEGTVDRATVVKVLTSNGVAVSKSKHNAKCLIIEGNGRVESQEFGERISRKMLQYLARHYNIPIHFFYNPQISLEIPNRKDLPKKRGA
jgi:hypothetical protein